MIEGCNQPVAEAGDYGNDLDSDHMNSSERVGTDSDQYSVSNATSFESFYNIRDDFEQKKEDLLQGI